MKDESVLHVVMDNGLMLGLKAYAAKSGKTMVEATEECVEFFLKAKKAL